MLFLFQEYVSMKLFKVNSKDTKMISMSPSGVFIVNFEQISHIVLAFPLLILNK